MDMSALWTQIAAGIISAVVAAVIIMGITRVLRRGHHSAMSPGAAADTPPSTSTPAGEHVVVTSTGDDAHIHAHITHDDHRQTNITKTVDNRVFNPPSGSGESSRGDEPWLWLVLAGIGILAATFVFLIWNTYVLLGMCIVLGTAVGAVVATALSQRAQHTWNRGATYVCVLAGVTVIVFVATWVGVFSGQRSGWSLHTLQAAAASTFRTPTAVDAGSFGRIGAAMGALPVVLGSTGLWFALLLLIAVLANLALLVVLFLRIGSWWWQAAVASGRATSPKHAEAAQQFAGPGARQTVGTIVGVALLGAIAIAAAWVPIVPA